MGRIRKITNVRDTFYILTNGKETEKNYFELLKTKKSIYKVVVKYLNDDPLQLVQHASEISDANQVWCVFDIDNSYAEGRLIPAINLANESRVVNIAFSNVAFEVWLLSHYKKTENPMNNSKLIEEMNELLQNKLGLKDKYNKANKELLEKYFIPKIATAVQNSKIVYQKRVLEHKNRYGDSSNYEIWKWNSCSNVFQLIEALKLSK